MISIIISILVFLLILSIIIAIHEGGHFFFAKKAGVLCYEFALGMGPVVYQKKKGETMYSIRAIPLGGFVSMAGEEVEADLLKDKKEVKLEFNNDLITKIILDINNPKYQDLETYSLVDYDLIGTKEAKADELYLIVKSIDENNPIKSDEVKYVVCRDAMIVYSNKAQMQIAPYDRTFVNKKLGARFMSVFAGPMMNFVLAWIIFVVMGLIGGYPNTSSTVISDVAKETPAYTAGLKENDKLLEIGNYSVEKWDDISKALNAYATGDKAIPEEGIEIVYFKNSTKANENIKIKPMIIIYSVELVIKSDQSDVVVGTYSNEQTNKKTKSYLAGLRDGDIIKKISVKGSSDTIINTKQDILKFFNDYKRPNIKNEDITFTVERDGVEKSFKIESYSAELLASQGIEKAKVQIGISPENTFDFVKLMYMPILQTKDACLLIFNTLKLLFTDATINVDDLSGPIGIFAIIKNSISQGLLTVLNWTAIISVNVGFMNLLPLPALDGGRLAFMVYEAITRKKPNPKVENIIHTIGFVLLMVLFVFVAFNDVIRAFFK